MEVRLRFDGETDDEFRARAVRALGLARILVRAALENSCVKRFIADGIYTEERVRRCPDVRVEYEQAVAIGDIGSCLASTKSKHWGDGPYILPLDRDDPVDPSRILYLYKNSSIYNKRFEQRRRLKELLGKEHRSLVTKAKRHTKAIFLANLTEGQANAIGRKLGIAPGEFWRAVKGRAWLDLAPRLTQLELDFGGS